MLKYQQNQQKGLTILYGFQPANLNEIFLKFVKSANGSEIVDFTNPLVKSRVNHISWDLFITNDLNSQLYLWYIMRAAGNMLQVA